MRDQASIETASEFLDRWIAGGTGSADRDVHASDMITDLLLSFDIETAEDILHRVFRDNTDDRRTDTL